MCPATDLFAASFKQSEFPLHFKHFLNKGLRKRILVNVTMQHFKLMSFQHVVVYDIIITCGIIFFVRAYSASKITSYIINYIKLGFYKFKQEKPYFRASEV